MSAPDQASPQAYPPPPPQGGRPPPQDPNSLPPDWDAVFDPSTGKWYFYNKRIGETTWTDPRMANPVPPPPPPQKQPPPPPYVPQPAPATLPAQPGESEMRFPSLTSF
ncbi:hypothetical protein M427DRAFT_33146 [Gonapodya prolifera JEL478]|uniref:WW domain-containing protein n=1 Tax=Gonapodya prolifera (strain JEL478) TaxID=1344416 RepID=A0A139AD03_GONPJ|nr:hypothetical protein M427DRAFT_33146 [Gonapodya prolifera JEL478]|eukprot:KXS14464.1 hypothetical protein M427DRAFT_33146 [Gonapodya prolifera JEL478]